MSPSQQRAGRPLRRVVDWLEHRTGIETAIRTFLYEDIPGSSGWRQVLGSVALFSFLLQVFTGILLAFNYAPTPGDAYNSVHYIVTQLTGGALIRGLHHWGASIMIVVVVLHLCQTFLWGAYKKPREATWMVGCVLLLLTLAFGLTGYLLPWDNRAYWGTVVTTRIAASAPILGPYIAHLMGGAGSVGVVTFARFYAVHVLLLPPLAMLLIGIHVYLVRKHGVAPLPEEKKPPKKFFPQQVFKDTVAIFIAFTILFVMAVAVRVPIERLADPTDTAYIPRPEWYFLFLFETLKFFNGPLEVVGSIVLPTLAILLLILMPFIDRGRALRVTQRTTAIGAVALAAIGWTGLTTAAIVTTPRQTETAANAQPPPSGWQQLSPEELSGVAYFRAENCIGCHPIGGGGAGPDLTRGQIHRSVAWLVDHFKRPSQVIPGSSMPPIALSDDQLNALATFVLKLSPANAAALTSAPQFAVDGARVYQENHCGSCHQLNGTGMQVGPALNGVAARRSRAWLVAHFADPAKLSPGSIMPAYKFDPKDLDAITSYLLAIPK
jgi:ubiquinol-cytochrome c reductase cytochrome b subunit